MLYSVTEHSLGLDEARCVALVVSPQYCLVLTKTKAHISQIDTCIVPYFHYLADQELGSRWKKDGAPGLLFCKRLMSKVIIDLNTVHGMYIKRNICAFGVLLFIRIYWLLRDPSRRNILESKHLAYLKIIDLLLIFDLNFTDTLAFVFITRNYGTIDPIDYFLQFFLARIQDFLKLLVRAFILFSLRLELIRLHEM